MTNVHGDLIEVNLYALDPNSKGGLTTDSYTGGNLDSYIGLFPYSAGQREIFMGRVAETDKIFEAVLRQRIFILYGRAGVGKTSLVTAGVIPRLMEAGALVICVQNYVNTVGAIKQALRGIKAETVAGAGKEGVRAGRKKSSAVETYGGPLPDNGGNGRSNPRRVILIFDQFERLFEPPTTVKNRRDFINDLKELTGSDRSVNILISVRDEASPRLAELQKEIPDLLDHTFTLGCLDREKDAVDAVIEPLEVLRKKGRENVSFEEGLVEKVIIPDLDALSPEPGVYPPHLQIVCQNLYEEVRKRPPYQITAKLYQIERKGAEGILANFLEAALKKIPGAEDKNVRESVLGIMVRIGLNDKESWITKDKLQTDTLFPDAPGDERPQKLTEVLDHMVEARLLFRRTVKDEVLYALASSILAKTARDMSGKGARLRHDADEELKSIWAAWLARGVYASREQLHYLRKYGAHLEIQAVNALFLIRSAIERGEPARFWLDRFNTVQGIALVRQLENGREIPRESLLNSTTVLEQAKLILTTPAQGRDSDAPGDAVSAPSPGPLAGAPGNEAEDGPEDAPIPAFVSVADSAINSPNPASRQTSALALSVTDPAKPVTPVTTAIQDKTRSGLIRWRRQAELLGTLTDSYADKIGEMRGQMSPPIRFLAWCWRVILGIRRNLGELVLFTVNGALGAGICLGAMMALISIPRVGIEGAGITFSVGSYFGVFAGAALLAGIALAKPLARGHSNVLDNGYCSTGITASKLSDLWLPVLLGALLFGSIHLVLALLINPRVLSETPLVVVSGFFGGAALSLALGVQRLTRFGFGGIGSWLFGIEISGMVFLLIQYIALRNDGAGIIFVTSLSEYRDSKFSFPPEWWKQVKITYPNWAEILSMIDATLVGMALFTGIALGVLVARKLIKRQILSTEVV